MAITVYDPIQITKVVETKVLLEEKGIQKKQYYRFRGGKWYGGIATADCIGCNLNCRFCWSWRFKNRYSIRKFYTPKQVANILEYISKKRGFSLTRVSGGEPTIGLSHLITLIEILESKNLDFILETNGILLGFDVNYAKKLAQFSNMHVRVSLKGTTPEEFHKLTGAFSSAFEFQLKALKNLLDFGISAHAAVMISFSTEEEFQYLKQRLEEIDPVLVNTLELEYVILYPHVVKILKKNKLKPNIALNPDGTPQKNLEW